MRNKTVVLARNCFNITGIIANIITPHMLNPKAWAWGAKAGYFWAGSCALCAVWTYFRLPEPKGRTYAEMDMLFEARVPARKFKSTDVAELPAEEPRESVGSRDEKESVEQSEYVKS